MGIEDFRRRLVEYKRLQQTDGQTPDERIRVLLKGDYLTNEWVSQSLLPSLDKCPIKTVEDAFRWYKEDQVSKKVKKRIGQINECVTLAHKNWDKLMENNLEKYMELLEKVIKLCSNWD
jgi:hypothetical protein